MKQSIVVSELEYHRTGVRGRKIFLMLAFLLLPAFLCLINLVIMVVLYTILDINYKGMASMSFFKDPQYVKWVLDADLENVVLHDSMIRGFSDRNIDIQGDNQNVTLSVEKLLKSTMSVTPEGTFLRAEDVKFVDPDSKKTILDLTSGKHVPVIGEFNGKSLKANIIQTPRIVSPDKENLTIASQHGMNIIGNEGLYADSRSITLVAGGDVSAKVEDDKYTLTLDGGGGGLKINPSHIRRTDVGLNVSSSAERYRLCICTDTGVLFRVRVTHNRITCAIAAQSPC